MALLDGGLADVFGAALAAFYRPATLAKAAETDDGAAGFGVAATSIPVLAMIEALSAEARAASGLPLTAVSLSVLRSGLPVAVDLDDAVTVGGTTYRVLRVASDPAGAVFTVGAVPV